MIFLFPSLLMYVTIYLILVGNPGLDMTVDICYYVFTLRAVRKAITYIHLVA